jgi:hypothetical protein
VIRCDVTEEEPEQRKHHDKDCELDNPAKKTSYFPSLADRVGLYPATRLIRIVRRKLRRCYRVKAMPALSAPECLLPEKTRQQVFPA